MNKSLASVLLTVLIAASGAAGENSAPQKVKRNPARRPMMSPPVYATTDKQFKNHNEITPEMRRKFEAARKRRWEIMVLISACKIMPEADRPALKAELLKRIEADFQAMISEQKERIAKAESDLQRFRNELADREKHHQELIERELDRLLKMQPPMRSKNAAEKK